MIQQIKSGGLLLVALLFCLALPGRASIACAVPGNIVANCGFENGVYTSTVGDYTNGNVPISWTANAAFDEYPSYNLVTTATPQVNSGSSALSLGNDDSEPIPGLSQTLADIAGATYQGSLYVSYGGAGQSDTNAFFKVLVNSNPVVSLASTAAGTYTLYLFSFVATGSDTLTLEGNTDPEEWYVDDVAVTTSAVAAPEPTSAALVGIGIVVFVVLQRKRSRITAILPLLVSAGQAKFGIVSICLLFFSAGSLEANVITVQNAGFETATLTDTGNGTYNNILAGDGTLADWVGSSTTSGNVVGAFSPSPGGPNWNSTWWSGNNIGYIQTGPGTTSLSQVLTTVLQDNVAYTLSALVGRREYTPNFNYAIQLWAGGVLLDSASNLSLVGASFGSDSLTYDSGADNALAGQDLEIVLSSTGEAGATEAFFDNISLTATSLVVSTPEPASPALAIFGLSALGIIRMRRKVN